MAFNGEIEPNYDAIELLFKAIATLLAAESSQLAVWFVEVPRDFSEIEPQRIGASSPFLESSSVLAGSGLLIQLSPHKVEKVIQYLTANDRLYSEVLHIQVESKGSVQWAAYDHFSVVLFGEQISLELLETLKSREVIQNYQQYDAQG